MKDVFLGVNRGNVFFYYKKRASYQIYNSFLRHRKGIITVKKKEDAVLKRIKTVLILLLVLTFYAGTVTGVGAAEDKVQNGVVSHTVVKGDTMWKMAVKYKVGLSEIISANPQIKNPDLIYPGDTLYIPLNDSLVTGYESEVVRLVNAIRVKNGLPELKENWELSRVARYKSKDMHDNRYFAHTSPTYGTFSNMIRSFGISYRTAGENIAYGYRTPQAVVDGWMNSEGHRANILNPSYKEIGVGYYADGNYWTQEFIG